MPVFELDKTLVFPPVHLAEPDGLLAYGGDLRPERLLLAYRSGIFPWYSEKPILWWSPDPRFVLRPADLKVSASMKQVLKKGIFNITVNKDFSAVMSNCGRIARPGQDSTWITKEMLKAYEKLHEMGHAVSVECWQENKLVGGLYGIRIGKCFFGESMFAKASNASKAAFITYVRQLQEEGIVLIDCQVETEHLASLGAGFMSRKDFIQTIQENF
ncbi:leucyl/phenylalanyl-tRNA--protein transferase [uncultured Chitinophaga sp.]|uniref:leucyl/phenylalanyl-tRNA--protein transferase n=1 Tax=uncultured Chitinophaga sp. TaxID=339340 RepID=UPI0025D19FC1|nr:leucyl/phenylalanyl-tRNA--protein transferase [uncultured Chitinophaga sp.]